MQLIVRIRSSTRSAEGRGVTAEGMANEQNYYLRLSTAYQREISDLAAAA